jgi:hypothetical protein
MRNEIEKLMARAESLASDILLAKIEAGRDDMMPRLAAARLEQAQDAVNMAKRFMASILPHLTGKEGNDDA